MDELREMISLGTSIRMKREKELELARCQIKDLQEVKKSVSTISGDHQSVSISSLTHEIDRLKVELDSNLTDLEKLKKEVLTEKDKNSQMMQDLHKKQAETQKVYPRARYAVNMYRDISHIRWQSDVDSTDVRGFTNSQSSSKTFKFDTSKQSQFFITNSLWDMESEST